MSDENAYSPSVQAAMATPPDELPDAEGHLGVSSPRTGASCGTPVLLVAMGRHGVGKTALLNMLAQRYRALGANLQIWCADPSLVGQTLSTFHRDTLVAPEGSLRERVGWLEERIGDQIARRYDAILDAAAGQLALNLLDKEVSLADLLAKRGVRFIAIYVFGPEPEDLEYLDGLSETPLFVSAARMLVLNAGLAPPGWLTPIAFRAVCEHGAFIASLRNGAKVTLMPALGRMPEIVEQGLSFEEAAQGVRLLGHSAAPRVDQLRVQRWWKRAIPRFFAQWRTDWLPRVPT